MIPERETGGQRVGEFHSEDWRKRNTTRSAVRVAIEKMLDDSLPEKYTVELFEQKSGALFQHMLEKYPQRDENVYARDVA